MLDLRTYLVTGAPETAVEVVRAAPHTTCIQVRSKPISAKDLLHLTAAISAELLPHQTLLIDDRVDVYLALKHQGVTVHGVHVGQDDLPVAEVRALVGPQAIVGLTTGTRDLVTDANTKSHLIDYIGAGPFRRSPTKDSGRPPLGLEGIKELAELSTVPVVAIGDVWPEDVPALMQTGIAGVAMVRAFEELVR